VFCCCFVYVTALSCILSCRICWFSCFAPFAVHSNPRSLALLLYTTPVAHLAQQNTFLRLRHLRSHQPARHEPPSTTTSQPYRYQIY
jgi:hypothetical protein